MVACQQVVLAFGWIAGAALLLDSRGAMLHWALHAALSSAALACFVAAAHPSDEALRAVGNLCVVGSMIALQRGVRVFLHQHSAWRWHAAVAVAVMAATWLGVDPSYSPLRVAVISGALAALSFAAAWDMQLAARWKLDAGWRMLLSIPISLAGLVFAGRAAVAVIYPSTVMSHVTANSALNVGSAMLYLVVALAFQLTLVGLVLSQFVAELKEASRFDPLTGVLNRRAIEEVLEAEVQRARRLKNVFSLLMIDADHFKDINDRNGHLAGDRALQHLCTVMASQMRDIDKIGRYGGEEFVVVLPATTHVDARQLAERLRERVESLPLRWQERGLALTVSIGLAQWSGDEDQLAALLARADAALYMAKEAGRNCVAATPAPPAVVTAVV